jgi:anionic cell wall polymer biosynthesis LytR-Cps2A-Psr (LCP) family protein
LNGEDALTFSRIRKYDGVFARMDRQILVVKAMAQKILSPKYFLQLPTLINTNLDEIVTSFGEKEIEMLLCIATQIDLDEVDNFAIGLDFGEHAWAFPSWAETGTQILVPDFEKIRAYVQEFIKGN